MKRLYVAETRDRDGKTVVTLGLTRAVQARIPAVGFIKPLGIEDASAGQVRIDADALLIERACGIHANIKDMSPVTVSRQFTEEIIRGERPEDLMVQVREAFDRVSDGKDLMVIEGTGHAAVGSVFGLSNARVAANLGAKVLIVASGGIGQPIDEVTANLAHYEKWSVPVLGVVFNKVFPEEMEVIRTHGARILEEKGIRLLGMIPWTPELVRPKVRDVLEALRGEVVHGEGKLSAPIERFLVGAMTAPAAMGHFVDGQLVVTPGDRGDIILAAVVSHLLAPRGGKRLAGLVVVGGGLPPEPIMDVVRRADVPVILTQDDTFVVAKRISEMRVRLTPADRDKIEIAVRLVADHVDIDALLGLL